jgi:alanyl-tRNA synthetase
VEALVNGAIGRDYTIGWEEMSLEKARQSGAIGLFADRYGERVKVYAIGDPERAPRAEPESPTFSREICGGPHVARTGELGRFRVVREQSASSGVRRVRAVLE